MSEDTDHWEQLQHWYRRREYPVQICVGHTADAAAALHTLTHLLKSSRVLFEVHPVSQHSEIRALVAKAKETQGEDAELLWVCLGCGAGVDLDELFALRLGPQSESGAPRSATVVHLIDGSRPVNLKNLSNAHLHPENIRVWSFDAIVGDANLFFVSNDGGKGGKKGRKKKRGRDDSSDDLSSSDSDGEEPPAETWLSDLHTLTEAKIRNYGAVHASSSSVAVCLYGLALLLRCPQESYLWNASVGLTDLYTRRLIPERTYTIEILKICSAINEWNTLKRANRLAEIHTNMPRGGGVDAKASEEQMHLSASIEYRPFLLLRHWSLWSSLWFQRDVAAWLGLYTDRGEETLRHLLAICGVSQQQANKPWASIPNDDRRSVMGNLQLRMMGEPTTDEYGRQTFNDPVGPFDKFDIRTVSRTVGYSAEVSAFDAVTLFNAVIAAEPPGVATHASVIDEDNAHSAAAAPSVEVVAAVESSIRGHQRGQFWAAHAVLNASSHTELFAQALEEAKHLNQSVFDAVATLLQPGAIRSTRTLHYVAVTERNMQAIERFWPPPRLLCCADQLLTALNSSSSSPKGGSTRSRPLVLTAVVPPVCSAVFQHSAHLSTESTEPKYVVAYAFPNVAGTGLYSSLPILQKVNAAKADRTLHPDPSTMASDSDGRWLTVIGTDNTTHFIEGVSLRNSNGLLVA